ncbi:uncharacterized protein L203_105214 [Cryptococcus depauperatus CBS 7841]|uniref:A to I editase domain-containing protein n=1 Tax=Cryptococcus depauperatus CBS 7841 TaxID=1295531 RepID=A0AAJ8JX05_9TREE
MAPRSCWTAYAVAQASIALYDSIPRHGKPIVRDNGVPEWTILSVISLVTSLDGEKPKIIPLSLGTGVKVLPYAKLPPMGDAIHDCHGEILARRGFVRWLIHQACMLCQKDQGRKVERGAISEELYLERALNGEFRLKDGVEVWLYISALPCGDASTMYTAAHQPLNEASEWINIQTDPSTTTDQADVALLQPLRGRRTYTSVATLRTKPGRSDSIPTTSMSCSDKISLWVSLGLQGGLLANLFGKIRLKGLVIGGVESPPGWENEEEWKAKVVAEVERALVERLSDIAYDLPDEYAVLPPAIFTTSVMFPHSKPQIISLYPGSDPQPSPLSLSYLPWLSVPAKKGGLKTSEREIISGGTVLGFLWKPPGMTVIKPKGRSRICKLEILKAYQRLLEYLDRTAGSHTYFSLKHPPDSAYQLAKALLRGRPQKIRGVGLWETLGEIWSTAQADISNVHVPPFKGWLENEPGDTHVRRINDHETTKHHPAWLRCSI